MNKFFVLLLLLILTFQSFSYAEKCSYSIEKVNYLNGVLSLQVKSNGVDLKQIAYFISELPMEINNGVISIKSSDSVDCWPFATARFWGEVRVSSSELAILLNTNRDIKLKTGSIIPSSQIQFFNIHGNLINTTDKIFTPNLYIPNEINSISDLTISPDSKIVKEVSGQFFSFVPASKKSLFKKPKLNLTVLTTSCNISSPPQCKFIIIQILQDDVLDSYFHQSELNDINNYQLIDQRGFLKQIGNLSGTEIGWPLQSFVQQF